MASPMAEKRKLRSRKRMTTLALVALAFVIFVFYSLERVEPVKVLVSAIQHEGDRVFVQGVLRNTGSDLGAVGLEVSYYDQRGKKLADDRIEVDGLRSDTDVPFKTPARELAGVSEFSLRVDRGHNPYGN